MWPKIVRMGTMKIPPAMPSMPPRALAATEIANSHKLRLPSISADCASRSRTARKAGYGTDVVPTVMEFLVIDGPVSGGVRRALDQEYGAAHTNTKGSRHCRVGRYSLQTVLRLHQR